MIKIGAVINNGSGTLPPEQAKERLEIINQQLKGKVSPGCLSIVPGIKVGQEIERLKNKGINVLIIGGGDGTVSTAAKLVRDTEISLLVLALGTRNHFARDLKMPLEPIEAISLIDRMNVKLIDLGEVNSYTFINNASIGVYPHIVKEREEKTEKHGWRKWWAQIVATMTVLRRLPRMRMTVESEKFNARLYTPFLFVGNNEYQQIITFDTQRPSINGGHLWLCVARSTGVWPLMVMAWQISINGIQKAENLETHLLSEMTVYPWRRKVTVALDGENKKIAAPLKFKTRINSLKVIVP